MENDKKIVDADKLVSRLLDIIEKQISQAPPLREKAPLPPESLSLEKEFSESDIKPLRVVSENQSEFKPEALDSVPRIEGPAESTSKGNALFICTFTILALAVIVISLRSTPEEVAQMNKKLEKEEAQFQQQIANQESIIRGQDSDIDTLERKLAATEEALTQNESALRETQSALNELQPVDRKPAATTAPITMTESQLIEQKRQSIAGIRRDYKNALAALTANKVSLVQDRIRLATNRLELEQTDLAIADLKNGLPVKPSNKRIEDFLPKGGASEEIGDPLEEIPSGELDAPLPNDLSSLVKVATNETKSLAHLIRKLKLLEDAIHQIQRDTLAVQDLLRDHRKTLETLASSPPVTEVSRK